MNDASGESVGSPADAVYETMVLAIEARGGTLEERHLPGLRLLAEMAANEAIRRSHLHLSRRDPEALTPTHVFRRLIAEHPGIDKEALLASAMASVPTKSTDPRNSFLNILNRGVRRFGYFVERDGRYYLPSEVTADAD